MSDPGRAPACSSDHCITCGDDGVPMTVVRAGGEPGISLCAGDDGDLRPVETALVTRAAPGDRLLVHAGVAIAELDPVEATA